MNGKAGQIMAIVLAILSIEAAAFLIGFFVAAVFMRLGMSESAVFGGIFLASIVLFFMLAEIVQTRKG